MPNSQQLLGGVTECQQQIRSLNLNDWAGSSTDHFRCCLYHSACLCPSYYEFALGEKDPIHSACQWLHIHSRQEDVAFSVALPLPAGYIDMPLRHATEPNHLKTTIHLQVAVWVFLKRKAASYEGCIS